MGCSVLDCAQLLGKKWTPIVLDTLFFEQGIPFNRLQKTLFPIQAKVLSSRLKELQKMGLVENTVKTQNKIKNSSYRLTFEGKELHKAFQTLKKWGMKTQKTPKTCLDSNCATCARRMEGKK